VRVLGFSAYKNISIVQIIEGLLLTNKGREKKTSDDAATVTPTHLATVHPCPLDRPVP
jgi:hypothetical protein